MPRYDYKCSSCNNRFELRQSFSAEPVTPCLECGEVANRQFHAPPVIFKGSGWYVNDYGKGRGNNPPVGDKKDSESSSESKSESSSESKSESSSESKSESAPATTSNSD